MDAGDEFYPDEVTSGIDARDPVGDDGEQAFGERIEQAARERHADSRIVRRATAGGRR